MSVTITRTNWIDDDGSGTVGTVINNAVKTELYGQIDLALSKVAQLNGDNVFTGVQSAPIVAVGPIGSGQVSNALLGVVHNGAINTGLAFINSDPGNTAYFLAFFNGSGGLAGYIVQNGATAVAYVTSSDARLKDDAGRATDLDALRALVVHDFTWRADGVRDRGIFAQEAHASYPRAVVAGTDEQTESGHLVRPWGIDYSKFVPDLIVGWQQHETELARLRGLLDQRAPQ